MNKDRKFQKVPADLVERGLQYGRDIVAWYASPEGKRSASRSVSGSWGAEDDPVRQAHGKIGEIATALYFTLDPLKVVKLTVGDGGDGGKDLRLSNGLRLDVKTTLPPFRLIWSMAVNHLYLGKQFDVLVSVSIDESDFSDCWIEGWITKQDFYDNKEISDGVNSNLAVGTWFMKKQVLSDIEILLRQHLPRNALPIDESDWSDLLARMGESPKPESPVTPPAPIRKPFEHYCPCGQWGSFGYGVSLLKDQEGMWFCGEHRPAFDPTEINL